MAIFHPYAAELFPTRIRAQAVGFTFSWSRVSSILVGYAVTFLLATYGTMGVFSMIAIAMLVIVLAVLGALGGSSDALFFAAVLIPPFHLYKQLKGAYRLGRAGALWRLFWLLNFTVWTTTLFVLLLLYLGVAD